MKRDNREQRTQGCWRAGRIRNLVVNPVYRGEQQYGRRIDQRGPKTERRGHEIISAPVTPLVSPALWRAAQETLARNRLCPKNGRRVYLLRGVIRCGIDGLAYTGAPARGGRAYYRCDGKFLERGAIEGRCPGRYVQGDWLETLVWSDVERWLRNPGDALAELDAQVEGEAVAAIAATESITLTRALEVLGERRERTLDLYVSGALDREGLDARLDAIAAERAEVERRRDGLAPAPVEPIPTDAVDLVTEVRQRLDAGLSFEQRQQIVQLLVGIVVHTEVLPNGGKTGRIAIRYRFPAVVPTRTGTGSSP